ncbi:PREDICTED: LOW QUALITY PROTEIN: DNA polymerase lambda-like [Branchiostoma belcheri]|uniref:DNA polymerase lambda n=1 Tax=Branchiostoma belcheri TaxID=7741 RepID=A0A6P4YBK9_BRABE|nr:PREDICTED: LOW QUALITY PROTEIN: DNA polymerase lambda-like [Branchiostoma belcheri]
MGDRKRSLPQDAKEPDSKRKKSQPASGSIKRGKASSSLNPNVPQIFQDVRAFLLPAGLGKARMDIFKRQIPRFGGDLHGKITDNTSHIVVDDNMDYDRLCRILKVEKPPEHATVVQANWVSDCIERRTLLEADEYTIKAPASVIPQKKATSKDEKDVSQLGVRSQAVSQSYVAVQKVDDVGEKGSGVESAASSQPSPAKDAWWWRKNKTKVPTGEDSDDSSYVPTDEEEDDEDAGNQEEEGESTPSTSASSTPNTSPHKLPRGKWVCAEPSTSKGVNYNKHITDKFQLLAKAYKNTSDQWRAMSYTKAIAILQRHPKPITSWEEAHSLPGVGQRLADKIWEVVESGHLRKLDHLGPEHEALNLFNDVWGAGAKTAQQWLQQGLRTLDDLRTKAKLTRQQQIGLKHYDDFLDRMPRDEAAEIEKTVREMAESINPGLMAMACGSYRRGKTNCGDVDVLITHPDGKSHKGIFQKVLSGLRETGFLTDDLVTQEDNGEQKKYLGVCRLPGEGRKHRRLDIIVVPYGEFACALMYFTGSAHFNRSMRALAIKKGMSLSEHSLNTGVIRKGKEKIFGGTPLPCHTEEDVFKHLGLDYRPPHERDW